MAIMLNFIREVIEYENSRESVCHHRNRCWLYHDNRSDHRFYDAQSDEDPEAVYDNVRTLSAFLQPYRGNSSALLR